MLQMSRIDISAGVWRKFRAIAVERGTTTPELIGSVLTGYVVRANRRRIVIAKEPGDSA